MTKEKELLDNYLKGWCDGKREGQNSQKEKCLKIIEEHIGCTDGDCLEIIKQKIKGEK